MATRKKGTWDINIEINGEKVKNNLNGVGQSIGKLRGQLRKLSPGTDEFIKKSAELKKAREQYKKINDEVNQTNISLEEAQGHWANLFGGAVSGDIKMLQSGLKGVVGNLKGMTKAAISFIATPLGAAIAVVSGIALGAKKWLDFNLEVEKTNQLIRDLTQESGLLVDGIRIRAEILQETFETDITASVNTAKSLVDNLGISYQEAFDIIEDGAVRGKLKNNEFLDSLKEYAPQFKNAGFTAKEFADVVSAGIDLSIYKDKLPDAIKEADLAIKEQTKATKDSLVNAFGAAFTTDLLSKVSKGEITTKQALQSIASESEKVNLNQQQQAQLTADLFKGAGEDAGGSIKIFKALNVALNDQKKPLTEIQQLQDDQLNANKELKGLYTQLFATASGGFGKLISKGKLFLTNVIIKLLKSGVDVYNWFVDLNNQSTMFSGSFAIAKSAISTVFTFFGVAVKTAIKSIGSLGTIIEGVFTLSPSKISEGFTAGIQNIKDGLNTLKEKAQKDAIEIAKSFSGGGTKMERFSLDNLFADTPTDPQNPLTGGVGGNPLTNIKEESLLTDLEKHEKKLEELQLNKEEETELLKTLQAKEEDALLQIKEKYHKKDLESNKKLAEQKKQLQQDVLNGAINVAGKESRVGQALLAIKGVLAAKESLLQLGLLKQKVASNVAGASADIAAGKAKTASVGFPQNIPLLIGFGIQVAGILSSIKNATKGVKLPGMYDGGFTPNQSFGNDRYGPITSFNHGNEYVVPEIVRADPTYATQINTLEKARTQKLDLPPTEESGASSDSTTKMLSEAVYMLIDKLDQPIIAQALIGDDEIERQKTRQEKLTNNRENAKIKS